MRYVLTSAKLIDGNGGSPLENAAVYVEGERIAWMGSAADLPPPKIAPGLASSPADLYHRTN